MSQEIEWIQALITSIANPTGATVVAALLSGGVIGWYVRRHLGKDQEAATRLNLDTVKVLMEAYSPEPLRGLAEAQRAAAEAARSEAALIRKELELEMVKGQVARSETTLVRNELELESVKAQLVALQLDRCAHILVWIGEGLYGTNLETGLRLEMGQDPVPALEAAKNGRAIGRRLSETTAELVSQPSAIASKKLSDAIDAASVEAQELAAGVLARLEGLVDLGGTEWRALKSRQTHR